MKRGKTFHAGEFFRERKRDLIFAGIALVLIIVTVVLAVQYTGLRAKRQSRPEEYGSALQELNDIRNQKSELESKIDAATQDLNDLKKKITALSGN